jgi:hypothetical protein
MVATVALQTRRYLAAAVAAVVQPSLPRQPAATVALVV